MAAGLTAGLCLLTTEPILGSRTRIQAEQPVTKSWRSSPVQTKGGRITALPRCHDSCMHPRHPCRCQPVPWLVSMRVNRTNAIRFILALTTGLWGAVCPQVRAADPVAIQFSLDRPIDAVAAPLVMAQTSGLFSAEGLAVTISAGTSAQETIARVSSGA